MILGEEGLGIFPISVTCLKKRREFVGFSLDEQNPKTSVLQANKTDCSSELEVSGVW